MCCDEAGILHVAFILPYNLCLCLLQTYVSSEPDDYIGREFSASFPARSTKANFSIPIVNDDIFELDENFYLTLEIPQPAANIGVMRGKPFQATVTIINDESECSISTLLPYSFLPLSHILAYTSTHFHIHSPTFAVNT